MEETIVKCVVTVSLGLLCNAVDCFRSGGLSTCVDEEAHHACNHKSVWEAGICAKDFLSPNSIR